MVIDATKILACQHEFILFPDHVLCHLCQHIREDLPRLATTRKSLLFFPVSVREEAMQRKTG